MPEPGGQFVVKITGNGSQLVAEFERVKKSGARTAKDIDSEFAAFQRRAAGFGRELAGAFGITLGVAGVVSGIRSIVEKTIEGQRALEQFNAVIKLTGQSAGLTRKQLDDLGREVEASSVFDDDEIRKAETALLRFRTIQGDVFRDIIKLGPDAAAALGTDLVSAVQSLAIAVTSPDRGFRRFKEAGADLSDQQKDLAERLRETGDVAGAQRVAFDELARSIGGSGGAETKGLHGALKRTARAWDDLQKAVGNKVLGADGSGVDKFTVAINRLKELVDDPKFKGDLLDILRLIDRATSFQFLFGPTRSASGKISGLPDAKEQAEQDQARIAEIREFFKNADAQRYEQRKKALQQEAELITQLNAGELQKRQAILDTERELAAGAYAQNLIDAEQFYAKLGVLAKKSADARVLALSKDLQAQQEIINAKIPGTDQPQFDKETRDRAKARALGLEAQIATTLLQTDRELLSIDKQRIDAAKRLRDEYADLGAELAAAQGRTLDAAVLQFDNARRQQVERLQAIALGGGSRGAEAANALRDIGYLREQLALRTQINIEVDKYGRLAELLDITLQRVDLTRQTGARTEIEAINARADAARAFIPVLQRQIEVYQELARALPKGPEQDAAIVRIEQLRLEIDKLKASTEELAKKFNDVFVGAFSDALTDLATGAKSFKDILKDLEKSIVSGISRIASQNIAETLFKPENFGGVGGFFAQLFGGKPKDAAGGAVLTTAGSTLTTAGATLTTGSTTLLTASTTLQAAAASMLASASAGLGSNIASSFLPGGFSSPGIGSDIFSFFGFASGGRPPVGKASLVGERGPELFVPDRPGTIIPNEVLTAKRAARQTVNQTINVNVSGSVTSRTTDQIAVEIGRATRRAIARNG